VFAEAIASYGRVAYFVPGFFLRLALRIALALARRRCSLLDTNHLFLRTALRMPLLLTSLRKRLSKCSCDSPGLN